jgi:hypothetical protein
VAGAGLLVNGVSLAFLAPLNALPLASVVSIMLFDFLLVSFFRLPNSDRLFREFSEVEDMFGAALRGYGNWLYRVL